VLLFAGSVRRRLLHHSISVRLFLVGLLGLILLKVAPTSEVGNNDESVLVIANGPSLSHDIKAFDLGNYDASVAVNFFAATDWFEIVRPKYYFIQDPFWFEPLRNLGPKASSVFAGISEKLTWNMELMFPAEYSDCETILALGKNSNITLRPLAQYTWPSFVGLMSTVDLLPHFSQANRRQIFRLWDRGLAQVLTNGVVQTTMFEFIRNGARKIDVLGLDMSMALDLAVDEKGQTQYYPRHFYGKATIPEKPLSGDRANKMADSYRAIAQKFDVFDLLAGYSMHRGCRVRNLSSLTLLDSFPRQ